MLTCARIKITNVICVYQLTIDTHGTSTTINLDGLTLFIAMLYQQRRDILKVKISLRWEVVFPN